MPRNLGNLLLVEAELLQAAAAQLCSARRPRVLTTPAEERLAEANKPSLPQPWRRLAQGQRSAGRRINLDRRSDYPDQRREALSQLRQLLRAVDRTTAPAWIDLDLTKGQLRTLFALQACGTASLANLAERLGVGAPAASTAVERLVGLGLIHRLVDATDRSRLVLSVSARGEDLLSPVRHGRHQAIEAWLARLDGEELENLRCGLRPLLRSMLADDDAAAREVEGRRPALHAAPKGRRPRAGFGS
jgi:DNA-binding MarR family transcriptional regulator